MDDISTTTAAGNSSPLLVAVQQQQHQQSSTLPAQLPPPPSLAAVGVPEVVVGAGSIMQNERAVVRKAGRSAIQDFLGQHSCFSILRTSGKVVVFDTRIPIQLAFYALVEHDMLAAPLWDPSSCQFVGLLTVTDFIDILRHYRATRQDVGLLATHSIAETFAQLGMKPREFRGADSSCTLRQACRLLLETNLDFVPVVFAEDMRVLSCITYTSILEHLVTNFREQRRLFDDSITDLNIGVYGDHVITTTLQETLSQALEKMHRHSLSALPVLAGNGGGGGGGGDTTSTPPHNNSRALVGVYSRSDITFLTKASDAEDAVRNLDLPLSEVLSASHHASQRYATEVTTPDALRTCSPSHTLQSIFESFAQLRFNRLYVVDEKDNQTLLGVVSAKDLVQYFLRDD